MEKNETHLVAVKTVSLFLSPRRSGATTQSWYSIPTFLFHHLIIFIAKTRTKKEFSLAGVFNYSPSPGASVSVLSADLNYFFFHLSFAGVQQTPAAALISLSSDHSCLEYLVCILLNSCLC